MAGACAPWPRARSRSWIRGKASRRDSHKTNFLPNLPDDVRRLERLPDYVRQPPVRAGDVLIFTEALIHGSAPWRVGHERRALLYKYSRPHSTWRKEPYDIDAYPQATERQRRLMAPPSVEDHARVLSQAPLG